MTDLKRVSLRDSDVVYGPVGSRRLGRSLGVNVNLRPGKTCTLDCVYCQYGRTAHLIPSPGSLTDWMDEQKIVNEVKTALTRVEAMGERLDSVTLSGFGESTLYPHLGSLVKKVKRLRDRYSPNAAVSILTNSSLICSSDVFEALKEFDVVIAKLDVGSQKSFEKANRFAEGTPLLDDIVKELARLSKSTGKVKLQTLIFKSTLPDGWDNTGKEEAKLLAEKVKMIDPLEVQVYTVRRLPSESFVSPVHQSVLEEVADVINSYVDRSCARVYL